LPKDRRSKGQRVKEKSGKFVERYFSLDDIPMIEATLKRRNDFRLIVIDPISSYYGKANSHNDSEVRGLLAPLAQLAQTYHVAILLVAHPNKGNHSNAANKVGGSVALNAACRASYMTFKDKADEQKRFMLPIKNNLGNDVDGLSYRCVEVEGECGKMSKIEWGGTTKLSADKWIVANEMKTVSKSDSAREWLRQKLVDNGPMLQTELEASAKDVGITEYALREAKKLLGIEPERVGFGGKWQWGLPQAF
jgi:putative DNA primase/helicase